MNNQTHYEVLGVSPAASAADIKKRYRDLARQYHPDVASAPNSAERFRLINEAYRILSDTELRNFYDSELKLAAMKRAESAAREAARQQPRPSPSAEQTRTQRGGSWQSNTPPRRPAAAKDPTKSQADVYLAQAKSAMRKFRYKEAESLCRQALRIDRRNVAAYEMLGDIHRARGDRDEAVAMYSYALQLDRNNRELREKFDRMVGEPTGPTMTGRAAAAFREKRPLSSNARPPFRAKLAGTQAVINGIGAALVGSMLVLVAVSDEKLASSPIFLEWAPTLLIGLASSGWMCGFVLAVNRRIGRFFDELTGIKHGTRVQLGPMVGAFTIVAAVISIYAGFLLYALLGVAQKFHSISLLASFAACLAIALLFTLAAAGAGFNVLISGGSVAFLAYLIGWIIGDTFR